MIHHKDWDINEEATGRFHTDPDTKKVLPIMGATLQNGLNDIEPAIPGQKRTFVPCDMGLDAIADGVTTHSVKRGRYGELRFSDTGSANKHLCKYKDKEGNGQSIKCIDGDSGLPDVSNGKPRFTASNGITIEHTPTYNGVKIDIVIDDPTTAPLEYNFSIKDYGQAYEFTELNGAIIATGANGKKVVYQAPYIVDADGESGSAHYVLLGRSGGYYQFKKVVDNETWFRQAAAPVRIDPNVTIEDGVGGGVIEDTFFNSQQPSVNFGSSGTFTINEYYAGAGQFGAILVDLSAYSGFTIQNGKFIFTRLSFSAGANYNAKCQKLLKPWVESIATWNIYDTALSWETLGARGATDRVATNESTFVCDYATLILDVSITPATLNEWAGGTNFGAIMQGDGAPITTYVHYNSSEGANPVQFYFEYTEGGFNGYPFFFDGGHY